MSNYLTGVLPRHQEARFLDWLTPHLPDRMTDTPPRMVAAPPSISLWTFRAPTRGCTTSLEPPSLT